MCNWDESNILFMTILATTMTYVGRGWIGIGAGTGFMEPAEATADQTSDTPRIARPISAPNHKPASATKAIPKPMPRRAGSVR